MSSCMILNYISGEVPVMEYISITSTLRSMATQVQILDEADCFSHGTNTLGKGMNPIILPQAMGK